MAIWTSNTTEKNLSAQLQAAINQLSDFRQAQDASLAHSFGNFVHDEESRKSKSIGHTKIKLLSTVL